MAWNVAEKRGETKRAPANKVVGVRPTDREPSGGAAGEEKPKNEMGKERDLAGGMEMLELDFLLGVIEDTKSDDKNDVAMRKLGFNELLRREQQKEIDSGALTVYAVDESNLYGKTIQCEAMKELTKRTGRKSKGSG
jgi:hypothetical protein